MNPSAREEKVRKDRLTQTEKDPRKAIERGWFHDPAFCQGYFDRCEDHALHIAPDTLDLAMKAVEIAASHGAREALASSIDGAQLRCRPGKLRGDNLHAARRLLARCADTRRDLTADQRKTLEELENVIENYPEDAFAVLGAYRRSFVAPVPGQLGERIGPR